MVVVGSGADSGIVDPGSGGFTSSIDNGGTVVDIDRLGVLGGME